MSRETFKDSEGHEHTIENSPHTDVPRPDGNSPYGLYRVR